MTLYYIFDEQNKELTVDTFFFKLTKDEHYKQLEMWNNKFKTNHYHQDQVSSILLNNFEFNVFEDFSK